MDNKVQSWVAIGLILVIMFVGFGQLSAINGQVSRSSDAAGSALTYSAARDHIETYNLLSSIITDLGSVRDPLAGVLSTTTAAIAFPAIASSSPIVATTTEPTLAAALGDIVLVRPSTSSPGFSFWGDVHTASTTAATFNLYAANGTLGAAAVAPSSTLFYITVIPRASFAAPAALTATQ